MPLNRSHETIVLDLFIASKVHDDVQAAEGRLSQQEAFRDLFNLMQLRARLEDLLCAHVAPLRLAGYITMLAPRRVRVVGPSRRTIVDVERAKNSR